MKLLTTKINLWDEEKQVLDSSYVSNLYHYELIVNREGLASYETGRLKREITEAFSDEFMGMSESKNEIRFECMASESNYLTTLEEIMLGRVTLVANVNRRIENIDSRASITLQIYVNGFSKGVEVDLGLAKDLNEERYEEMMYEATGDAQVQCRVGDLDVEKWTEYMNETNSSNEKSIIKEFVNGEVRDDHYGEGNAVFRYAIEIPNNTNVDEIHSTLINKAIRPAVFHVHGGSTSVDWWPSTRLTCMDIDDYLELMLAMTKYLEGALDMDFKAQVGMFSDDPEEVVEGVPNIIYKQGEFDEKIFDFDGEVQKLIF